MPVESYAVVETRGEAVTLIATFDTAPAAAKRAEDLQAAAGSGVTYTALPARVWRGRAACD